jgi:NAD(P)-dependent dehydrogenase (short-subunit alcohol dehydrogenase family)
MDDFKEKVAVVTGAASGIGLAMAKRFAAEGMRIALADIERAVLADAEETVRASGAREVLAVTTDVSQLESVEALADVVRSTFGTWHVVCNNAGVIYHGGPAWEMSTEAWSWVLGVNLMGVINGVRTFMPDMVARDEGHMVNTASSAAMVPVPGSAPYSVSKFGVVGLTEGMFHELHFLRSQVGVSVLCPALVRTHLHEAVRNWPAEKLGARPADPERLLRQEIDRSKAQDPTEIANLVFDAIRKRRFWIFSTSSSVDTWVARTLAAQNGENPPVRG